MPDLDAIRLKLASETNQRVRRLVELILERGSVTTEELRDEHGYQHPPRAKRDAIERGYPIEMINGTAVDGRRIGRYQFADGPLRDAAGRRAVPKQLKDALIAEHGEVCAMCGSRLPGRLLQVDHRIPFEISDKVADDAASYQLLCGSCNRSKSWTCENECSNWEEHDLGMCSTCLLAEPTNYEHLAGMPHRMLTLTWDGHDVVQFDRLRDEATKLGISPSEWVMRLIAQKSAD